jgi:hypothetical protein
MNETNSFEFLMLKEKEVIILSHISPATDPLKQF